MRAKVLLGTIFELRIPFLFVFFASFIVSVIYVNDREVDVSFGFLDLVVPIVVIQDGKMYLVQISHLVKLLIIWPDGYFCRLQVRIYTIDHVVCSKKNDHS